MRPSSLDTPAVRHEGRKVQALLLDTRVQAFDLPPGVNLSLAGYARKLQLALNLRRRYPGVQIVGGYCPPFRELTDEERDAVVAEINHARPDVVWVGIGVPKQEKWMAAMRDRCVAACEISDAALRVRVGAVRRCPATRDGTAHRRRRGACAKTLPSR